MEEILHELLHALIETAKTVPFLFVAYLLMEFIEHKVSEKMENSLKKIGNAGPAIGSALGCIPQCGFSATASNLYTAGLITEGTLIAVFLSTSDEALPILISTAGGHGAIWKLILCKVGIGIISGFLIDLILRKMRVQKVEIDMCKDCGCEEEDGILKPTIKHTIKTTVFILIINVALGLIIHFIGHDALRRVLLTDSVIQPLITALFGLIPNCAVSVMITNLYIEGALSFGSAVAGLCSGAGVGLTVLLKANKCKKENIRIICTLYGISAIFGIILALIGVK